jgi:hypothetical protein
MLVFVVVTLGCSNNTYVEAGGNEPSYTFEAFSDRHSSASDQSTPMEISECAFARVESIAIVHVDSVAYVNSCVVSNPITTSHHSIEATVLEDIYGHAVNDSLSFQVNDFFRVGTPHQGDIMLVGLRDFKGYKVAIPYLFDVSTMQSSQYIRHLTSHISTTISDNPDELRRDIDSARMNMFKSCDMNNMRQVMVDDRFFTSRVDFSGGLDANCD